MQKLEILLVDDEKNYLEIMMPKLDGFEVCRMLKFDDNSAFC